MLGEISTALSIIKGVMDIWDRVKPKQTVESVRRVAREVEQHADTQDVGEVIQTFKVKASKNLSPADANELISDVKYRWTLESLKDNLRQKRGWLPLEAPEFLLVMEKVKTMGQLMMNHNIMGFVSGPGTAQAVDRDFERWKRWLSSMPGSPQGLLVYVYDNLSGVSADHIVGKKSGNAIGGYLDLSQMKLEGHKGILEKYSGTSLWEVETQDALKDIHDHYLRISGYFK